MNLRTRLLLLILLAAITPVIVVGVNLLEYRQSDIALARRQLSAMAQYIAKDLTDTVRGTAQLHYGLSRSRDLDTQDKAACSAFLATVLKAHPQYTGILTITPDGDLFCDSLRTGKALHLTDRRYFQQAIASGNPLALEPAFGRLTGIAVLQIAWAARHDTGELRFVQLASLNLEKYVQSRSANLPFESPVLALMDSKGTMLAWHPGGEKLRGASFADSPLHRLALGREGDRGSEDIAVGGTSRVWATATLSEFPDAGLYILIGVSRSELVAAANKRLGHSLGILGVFLLLALFGAWALAELGVRRPSARIIAAVTRFSRGDFGARIGTPHPRGELGELMTALNDAFQLTETQRDAIERLNADLEHRIVERTAALSRLTVSEKHYRTLFEVAHDAILVADDTGRILDANPSACTLTGYPAEELPTLRVNDLLPTLERPIDAAAGNRPQDYDLVCKGGVQKQVELSVSQAPAGGSVYALRDMTDHRRLQKQYLQSEKLAAMSAMLAGVAHELNNPLSVVAGHAEILSAKAGTPDLAERARKISDASKRCTRIVKNFLSLARQHPPDWQRTKLASVVHGVIELFAYPFRMDDVEATVDLESDLPAIWADPHQLHQVLLNLVTNAHHAVREAPRQRRITIAARYNAEARRVSLEVSDTGPGIPPEIMDRLFEPFFTTKPVGKGSGLGLSLCKGIVESHGGTIRASSVTGQGATFVVDLPVETPASSEQPPQSPESLPPIGKRTFLVVDDEQEIANLLVEMLTSDGHRIDTAPNGAIALQKLSGRQYDLILSDIRMPEMDGIALYHEVQRRYPALARRFVFISGDTLGDETARFLVEHRVPSLSKPINAQDVQLVIRRVLQVA